MSQTNTTPNLFDHRPTAAETDLADSQLPGTSHTEMSASGWTCPLLDALEPWTTYTPAKANVFTEVPLAKAELVAEAMSRSTSPFHQPIVSMVEIARHGGPKAQLEGYAVDPFGDEEQFLFTGADIPARRMNASERDLLRKYATARIPGVRLHVTRSKVYVRLAGKVFV